MKRCFVNSDLRPEILGSVVGPDKTKGTQINRDVVRLSSLLDSEQVLVIGSSEDPTIQYFVDFARSRHVPVALIPVEALGQQISLDWHPSMRFESRKRFGIYHRLPGTNDPQFANLLGLLHVMLVFLDGIVVNRPSRRYTNHSKPLQTAFIAREAIKPIRSVPTWLSTVWPTEPIVSDMTVVKSISSLRSYAVTLSDERLTPTDFDNCPVQLQTRIIGDNIRAHVCGDSIVSVKLTSSSVDYRTDEFVSMQPVKLPATVESWCRQIAKAEGLEFAGIDFIKHPRRTSFYCLEINPAPGYYYFEQHVMEWGVEPLISEWLLDRLVA